MCTSLQLKAKDGSVVVGRTMEFPTLMDARLVILPRGLELHSYAPDNKQGVTWATKYGAVGIDAFPNVEPTGYYAWTDGMNEKGLYVALQYHPGTAVFSSPDGVADDKLMSAIHLATLTLTTCANVSEVRAKLGEVVVWPFVLGPMGMAPPCHFVFHDAYGACIAVEWDAGEMKIYDNPYGVFTNSPEFTWHTTNLRNYTHLSPDNPGVITVAGQKLAPFGVGQGMQGLPGDNSSPSRFVRAAVYVATAPQQADAAAAQHEVFHMMNNFDIPDGFSASGEGVGIDDVTYWTTISNLADLTYNVRTVTDSSYRKVALADLDFEASAAKSVDLPANPEFAPFPGL
jgi:choloylglycine hydrolase